jgi:hypothetical protein
VAKRKRPKLTWRCRRDLARSNRRRAAGSDSGLAGPLVAEPGPRAPAGRWQGPSSPSPAAAPGGICCEGSSVASAHSDWTLGYLRRPAFKLARKPRQGPWALTQGKGNLIAIALATVPWWAEVRCHSGIDHGDGASSLGSCMELGGAAAGMLRSGPRPAH